jgi:hypothetical protein
MRGFLNLTARVITSAICAAIASALGAVGLRCLDWAFDNGGGLSGRFFGLFAGFGGVVFMILAVVGFMVALACLFDKTFPKVMP